MIHSVEKPLTVVDPSDYPLSNQPEFLLLGRSNVGKSSFINTLLNRKNFAYISQNPGKTQTMNFYLVNGAFYLVDAPGYGYARASKQKRIEFGKMIEAYLKERANLTHVFLLVDARHQPTEDDKLMREYLSYYHMPFSIIATKADKLSGNQRALLKKKFGESLNLETNQKVIPFSSITRLNRETILEYIEKMLTISH